MRRKFIGANWKMNLSKDEAEQLFIEISDGLKQYNQSDVVIFPPQAFLGLFEQTQTIKLGAQNAFGPNLFGAFTGETSLSQLSDLGITSLLVGHSERRINFFENDHLLCQKTIAAINLGFQVVFCCGEPLEVREKGEAISYIRDQINPVLNQISSDSLHNLVIAYEPIWAIGTGIVPGLAEVQEIHESIRAQLRLFYGDSGSQSVRIIYGGSCNAENARMLFSLRDVDGGLIGGASLQSSTFLSIVSAL